ncbi:MAG: Uma2 family endonuclease [Pseudanabaenaceae cyanobacterium]
MSPVVAPEVSVFRGNEPWSDEPEMESSSHSQQLMWLVAILEHLWADRDDFFIGANLTVYFSPEQVKHRDFRGPDFFVVRNTERRERRSWATWEEGGRYPDLIVELLSSFTAAVDRGLKKQLYQERFRTPEYFWFSPDTAEFAGFRLGADGVYAEIVPNAQDWRWSEVLELYLGVVGKRLRYFTATGELVPTPAEAAAQARQQVDRERAEQEKQRVEVLAARLRALGYEP